MQLRRKIAPPRAQKISTQADVVFCIDSTGSMQPCIDGVRKGLVEFAKGLQTSANVDFRLRAIAYRDLHDPRCQTKWQDLDFTSSAREFEGFLSSIIATGGGDAPESTLDALYMAIKESKWRTAKTHKTIVLLTDDDTHKTLHESTYPRPDRDVFRVIQEFQTLGHAMLFIVAPKFPLYEQIEQSMKSADRKVVAQWVPYGNRDSRYKGLAGVNWSAVMSLIGKTVSATSVVVSREI